MARIGVGRTYANVGGMRMLNLSISVEAKGFSTVVQTWGPSVFTSSRSLTPMIAHAWSVIGDKVCRFVSPEKFSWAVRLAYSSGKKVEV
jgi:hypothetical protein